jgi:hypothetical protein
MLLAECKEKESMMNISESFKKMLIEEIYFVVERMNKSQNDTEKLFYFSAVYGIFQRIFNLEYDSDLVYAYVILRSTHEEFTNRLRSIQQGEAIIPLFKDVFTKLTDTTKELGEDIASNRDFHHTLKKFVLLTYSITGNGHYLMQKGWLKL